MEKMNKREKIKLIKRYINTTPVSGCKNVKILGIKTINIILSCINLVKNGRIRLWGFLEFDCKNLAKSDHSHY